MAHVTVLYFATLREQKGTDRETVEVFPGESVSDLYARLFPGERVPVAFARNESGVPADTAVTPGDEIAFLPPLGGG